MPNYRDTDLREVVDEAPKRKDGYSDLNVECMARS